MEYFRKSLFPFLAGFTTIFVAVVELSEISVLKENRSLIYFLVCLCIFLFGSFLIIRAWFRRNSYKDIQIAILGSAGVGKTVFITVLFDEIQRLRFNSYQFLINDKETLDFVLRSINKLLSGVWLPRTAQSEAFLFKAILVKHLITKQKHSLSIADYSGEAFVSLNGTQYRNPNQEFFGYIQKSKILFFAVGIGDSVQRNKTISEYIAVVNLLASESGSHKIEVPVCLLFLKSDKLRSKEIFQSEEEVSENFNRLIKMFELKCRKFKVFFVSAIGPDASQFGAEDSENPPNEVRLTPKNVTEPLLWAISQI